MVDLLHIDMVIFDEAHYLKNPKSKRHIFGYSLKFARRKFKEKKYVKAIGSVFGGILISAILKAIVTGIVRTFLLSYGIH